MVDFFSNVVFVEFVIEILFVEVVFFVVDDWFGVMIIKVFR